MRWRHPSSLQHVPPVPIHITVIGAVENQSGHACCRPIRCMLFQKDFEVVLREEPIRIFSDQVRYGFYSRHGECRFLRMLVTGKCCKEWVTDEGSQDDPVECGATESERVCEKMALHPLACARGSEGVAGFRVSTEPRPQGSEFRTATHGLTELVSEGSSRDFHCSGHHTDEIPECCALPGAEYRKEMEPPIRR